MRNEIGEMIHESCDWKEYTQNEMFVDLSKLLSSYY